VDKINIDGLALNMCIGVYDWERTKTQPILLDLCLSVDTRTPAMSDDVADALDYDALCRSLQDFSQQHSPHLIENFAEQIAQFVLSEYPCEHVRVRVNKPQAIDAAKNISVEIERSRDCISPIN